MGSEPLKLQEKLAAQHHARWEAVETVKAQELAALTEERAREMIRALRPFVPIPPKPGFAGCWVRPGQVPAELEAIFGLPEGRHPGIWFRGRRAGPGVWR